MITLGEYMSFIFSEITRARQYADAASIEIAKSYAKDDVLKYFSIPRFKIPEMELSIPVLIADANYDNQYIYKITDEQFLNKFSTEFDLSFNILLAKIESNISKKFTNDIIFLHKKIISLVLGENLNSYDELMKQVSTMIEQNLDAITTKILHQNLMLESYMKDHPKKEHFIDFIGKFKKFVLFNIKLSKSTLTNLLINPETSVIGEGATEISVFHIKAKITEEGIFVNSMKDKNGKETFTVNFE
ncbi:MAG: hypothetical protein KIH69_023250 [Anaerolineae bacterium]|nr:hypothetical protein [Anaerolineae bacterium]